MLQITIDGPAGVGKSTAAKMLARRLGLLYLDTGATYRALAYQVVGERLEPASLTRVLDLARHLQVRFKQTPDQVRVFLDGADVTQDIRTERVTEVAAIIAQFPQIRAVLVELQRRLASAQPCVVEGRDTGSVVFPQAPYKFFLTASSVIRAKRRHTELSRAQVSCPSLTALSRQLRSRDRLDRTRQVGPLVKPKRAIVINTSHLSAEEVIQRMLRHLARGRFFRDAAARRPKPASHRAHLAG